MQNPSQCTELSKVQHPEAQWTSERWRGRIIESQRHTAGWNTPHSVAALSTIFTETIEFIHKTTETHIEQSLLLEWLLHHDSQYSKISSVQDFSFLNQACLSLSCWLMAFFTGSKIILITLFGNHNKVIHLHLPYCERSLFFLVTSQRFLSFSPMGSHPN